MSKREFLDALSRALTGKVNAAEVSQHITYYSDYIDKQIRLGKSEEEVVKELGDPRLLVKSIVNAENAATERQGWGSRNAEYTYEAEDDENVEQSGYHNGSGSSRPKVIPWWLVAVIVLLVLLAIVIGILSALGSLVIAIFSSPILMGLVFAVWLVHYMSRKR